MVSLYNEFYNAYFNMISTGKICVFAKGYGAWGIGCPDEGMMRISL
jgi:hypothetical protein